MVATPEKPKRRSVQNPEIVERSVRVDAALYQQVAALARKRRTSIQALLERALHEILMADTASRADANVAPIVNRVLHDRHRSLEKGLRKLIAVVGHEVLRSQYLLCEFFTEAGIKPSRIATWREEGYRFATKELQRRKSSSEPDEPDESVEEV